MNDQGDEAVVTTRNSIEGIFFLSRKKRGRGWGASGDLKVKRGIEDGGVRGCVTAPLLEAKRRDLHAMVEQGFLQAVAFWRCRTRTGSTTGVDSMEQ